ncbi:MAG TPA: hypothetical protein VFI11_00505, partial [Anaerolineales bacterium]|nr:hypothetical protein [Anaerolineales bacterium]
LDSHWLPDERLSLLGSVVNPFRRPVVPSALIAVGMDDQERPMTYAPAALPAGHLRPGEPVPFRADVPSADDVSEWVIVGHAIPSTPGDGPAVALQGELSIRRDPQGQLFAVGRISNGSDAPQWAQVGALLSLREQWVSLGVFETPTVIPAGASLPFAIDIFPGAEEELAEHEADRGDLEVEPFLREAGTTAVVREIDAEVRRFEVIGSRLYLRGVARNPGTTAARACIVAAVLSDEGDLLTAGWTAPAETVPPGGEAPFMLVLPVPDGVNLSLAEFDVQAFGVSE